MMRLGQLHIELKAAGVMFFSGEPGASIPGVRNKIEELYGARVIDCGSMS